LLQLPYVCATAMPAASEMATIARSIHVTEPAAGIPLLASKKDG